MPIKKKEVMWEELEKFTGGAYVPSPHTHPRSEVTDFWDEAFWANIPDKPSTYPPSSHNHNDLYYTEGEIDTKLALQDTLAEMDDTLIVSPADGELLVWDADSPPSGKWICSTQLPSHNHDDRYYTETELNNGQLDNVYFGEDEFLVTSAGAGDSGKPIKLNAAGLVDNTMLTTKEPVISAGTTAQYWRGDKTWQALSGSHSHDDLYYTESEVDTKLALQDTLAEMDDTIIISPEDGELLVYDSLEGKWICSTGIPSHTHDDRYYTETELNNGQLDNIYFGEDEFLVTSAGVGDAGKPIKLNAAGMVDATMIPGGGQDELVKVGAAGGSDYLNASYFERDIVNHVRIKLNTLLTGVDVDKLDGLHASSLALTTRALDAFGATTDITTLNATTAKHGLLMKLGGGTANFLRADGTWTAPPSVGVDLFFRAYMGANQSIGASATTKLQFNTENYDPDSKFFVGLYEYSPGATGYFRITATVYTYLDVNKVGILYIYKNGAEYCRYRYSGGTAGFKSLSISSDIYLSVSTDDIAIYYFNGDTAARSIYSGSNQSWFEGAKFG